MKKLAIVFCLLVSMNVFAARETGVVARPAVPGIVPSNPGPAGLISNALCASGYANSSACQSASCCATLNGLSGLAD